jgi:hypothetical protein
MVLADERMSRKSLSGQMLVFLVWLGITIVGAFLTPDPSGHGTHTQLGLPPCPSVLFMRRPCPGCGLTTSFTATIHGDLPTAFAAHLFGPIAYLGLTAYALLGAVLWLRRRPLVLSPLMSRTLTGAVVIFVGFGVLRAITSPDYEAGPEARFVQKLMR